MGAFELKDRKSSIVHGEQFRGGEGHSDCKSAGAAYDHRRLREENLIVFKIYDSARKQECLDYQILGAARAAEEVMIHGHRICEGDIITPPCDAASVSIDKLRLKKVLIVDKQPNCFKKGYWDIEVKFVFEYKLVFREANGCIIGSIKANSIYNKKMTMFGSEGADFFMATDMFMGEGDNMLGRQPFVNVEAKAMSLQTEIKSHRRRGDEGREVAVTLGLFFIIKLFRIVDLSVESRGFAIPKENCDGLVAPCDFFEHLHFPMDVFSPPQRPEFMAGISGDIPPSHKCCGEHGHHGHGHHGHGGHGGHGGCGCGKKDCRCC